MWALLGANFVGIWEGGNLQAFLAKYVQKVAHGARARIPPYAMYALLDSLCSPYGNPSKTPPLSAPQPPSFLCWGRAGLCSHCAQWTAIPHGSAVGNSSAVLHICGRCWVRAPSACTVGPNSLSSLSLVESDGTIGIGAVWLTLAEASPPMTAIGHISISIVLPPVCHQGPFVPGAFQGK